MTVRMSDAETWRADWLEVAKFAQTMASSWPTYVALASMPSTALDGYGAGGGNGGRAKGTHGDPVARLVERKEGAPDDDTFVSNDEWRDAEVDRIHTLVVRLYGESTNVMAAVGRLEGLKRLIDNRGDARYGRQSSVTDCLCCEATVTGVGEDRIVSGYCPPCKQAWMRYREREQGANRDPDHEMFRRFRRGELAQRDERAS